MPETTSPATSTDPGSPSSTTPAPGGASPTSPPTTPPSLIAPSGAPGGAPPAPTAASPRPSRPDGVPESFWDNDKGELKTGDWARSYEELRAFKAEQDARKALVPAQADLYKPELPKDLKLPVEMEIKTNDPLYLAVRDMAHVKGWTQEDFSQAIGAYAKIEAAKYQAIQDAIKQRDEALGQNGPQRVEELKKWFGAQFGHDIGAQFNETLFTPGIVSGFEKVRDALSRQGVKPFSAAGREPVEGRADGLPDNWDKLDLTSKREWFLKNPNWRSPSRAA